ncbi:FecR family protein [Chitinophaga sp. 30R24]|uniref:FecR family protein n=1 Tax=Chitinophaga sp. 30R24 TaxID=3248838 RepID=UPI003B90EB39
MHQKLPQDDLYQLIKNYRKGTCTTQEIALLFKWLEELGSSMSPEEAAMLQTIRNTMKNEVWKQQEKLIRKYRSPLHFTQKREWQMAAAFAGGLLLIGYTLFHQPSHTPETALLAPTSPGISSSDSTIINHTKEKQRYQLADGSVVTLFAHSYISIKMPWPQSSRNVQLNGKALFEVAKDANHTFTVNTKRFSTTVLGTVFQITAYDSMTSSRVQLLSGSIAVKSLLDKTQTLYLSPGDDYSFDNRMHKIYPAKQLAKTTADISGTEASIALQDNIFYFNNAPLTNVFNALSHQYNIAIDLAPALKLDKRKYTGNIKTTKSLDEILVMLAGLNDLKIDTTISGYLIKAR